MATSAGFVDVVMPQMGVSVSEGTVTRWMRNVGDTIEADEPLLEISTDKVDTEVPSPGSGVLLQILVAEGETVPVGTLVARIGPAGTAEAQAEEAPAVFEPQYDAAELAPVAAETVALEPETIEPEPFEAVSIEREPFQPEPFEREPAESEPSEPEPLLAEPFDAEPDELDSAGAAAAGAPAGNGSGERVGFISPVVARIAAEHGVDVTAVSGTGRDGRVTKKDILAFVESGAQGAEEVAAVPPVAAPEQTQPAPQPTSPAQAVPTPRPVQPPAPPQAPTPTPAVIQPAAPAPAPPAAVPAGQETDARALESDETLTPMSAMRRGIAEHMRRSLDTAAHVTSAIEVDMSKVVAIRDRLKNEYRATYGVNLTYLAFVSRATVETLRDWPYVNAEIRGDSILTHGSVNLGFAVALDAGKGLIVPVLKHAEGLNLLGMARGVADLAERARTKKLLPDDVQGGTFTITNPGSFGTFIGTPVISQPQTGILGTYAVVKRAWVITDDMGGDAIAIRPMMNLTLTYDHRLVDGAYAGQFLRDLTERLQTWGESDY